MPHSLHRDTEATHEVDCMESSWPQLGARGKLMKVELAAGELLTIVNMRSPWLEIQRCN